MPEQMSLTGLERPAPRVLTFDLETLRSAGEVGGWEYLDRMGVACAVTYDSIDREFRTYLEPEMPKLVEDLSRADLVVGFNHIRFDYGVLAPYTTVDLRALPSFDMLEDVTRILGHRLKLNSLVAATLGDSKSADGLQSLRWVKEGRFDLVCEYCRQDVDVTRRLFEFGVKEGRVRYERSGELTWIPVDWNVEHRIDAFKTRR